MEEPQQNSNPPPAPRLSFEKAVVVCLRNYANFEGRARRSEFWWFYLFQFLCSLLALLIDMLIFGKDIARIDEIGVVGLLVSLALFLPATAAAMRRLHDTGRSGWWVIVYILGMPIFALGLNIVPPESTLLFVLASLAVFIYFLTWMIERGTQGNNRFGADPTRAPHKRVM